MKEGIVLLAIELIMPGALAVSEVLPKMSDRPLLQHHSDDDTPAFAPVGLEKPRVRQARRRRVGEHVLVS